MQKVNFPFAHKLALAMITLIVCGMLLLGGLIIQEQNKLFNGQMHAHAKILIHQLTASASDNFLTSDNLGLDVLARNIAQYPEVLGVAFYSEEQQQRSVYGLIPSAVDFSNTTDKISTLSWPENVHASQVTQISLFPASQAYISYLGRINYQDVTIGYVLLTFDQSLSQQARNTTLYSIALTTMVLIACSILIAFFLGKRFSRPVEALLKASDDIAKGNYSIHFDEYRKDEFGLLMQSLKSMADSLLQKETVEKAFSRYLSPTVAREVLDNNKLGGQQIEASVLFVDIIDFTSLSRRMNPEQLNHLLNEFFSSMSQAADIYGGHVDKFIGDCAMLVFGVPRQDEHHSRQAIACALLIQKIIFSLNKQRTDRNQPPVNFHIAANSGLMLAGNLGSKQRMEYTVVGDAVNLAASIAGHAENNEVIIPETMLKRPGIMDNFEVERKGGITLRGHDKPVILYRVNCSTNNYQIDLTKNMDKLIKHDFANN